MKDPNPKYVEAMFLMLGRDEKKTIRGRFLVQMRRMAEWTLFVKLRLLFCRDDRQTLARSEDLLLQGQRGEKIKAQIEHLGLNHEVDLACESPNVGIEVVEVETSWGGFTSLVLRPDQVADLSAIPKDLQLQVLKDMSGQNSETHPVKKEGEL
jgi:hypothetical protein